MCSFMEIIAKEKNEKSKLQKDYNLLKTAYDKLYHESRLIPLKRRLINIGTQIKINTSDKSTQTSDSEDSKETQAEVIIEFVNSLPGNDCCCDCGAKNVSWISLKFGVILCIQCSSFHHFGVLRSQVQSLTLDNINTRVGQFFI